MDLKVAFGLDTNVRKGQDMEFFNIAKDVFEGFKCENWTNTFFFQFTSIISRISGQNGNMARICSKNQKNYTRCDGRERPKEHYCGRFCG